MLSRLQVTARSMMGALALSSGGMLVDHGWVRLLGGVCRLESRPGGPTTISIMLPRWQPLVETATAGVAAA